MRNRRSLTLFFFVRVCCLAWAHAARCGAVEPSSRNLASLIYISQTGRIRTIALRRGRFLFLRLGNQSDCARPLYCVAALGLKWQFGGNCDDFVVDAVDQGA